jgi:hypothetical protein
VTFPLGLDEHGQEYLAEWIDNPRTADADVNRVLELLDDFAWGRCFGHWPMAKDTETGDWLIRPRDDLRVVLRPFAPDTEGEAFSIVYIGGPLD